MDVRTLGIDLVKNLFQVHGVDGQGSFDSRALCSNGARAPRSRRVLVPLRYTPQDRHVHALGSPL